MTTANLLSHALGLPHHVDSLMLARRDKAAMNAALRDAGLPSAHTVKVQGGDDIDSALEEFTLPVIVKPVDSAGGDGCVVCWQASDVAAAVEAALGQRNLLGIKNSEMLIQDYLDGQQFIVNTVSIGGRHLVSDVHTVRVDRVGGRSVMRHSLLVTEMDASATLMVQFTLRCLDAVGIREGAAHTEVRLTAEGPRLIEVNARIMGASLEPSLYRTALGYTQADLVAERFTNPDAFVARFDSPYAPHAAMAMAFLYVSEPGTVVSSPGLDLVRTLPGLHSMEKLPAIGATIAQPWMCTGQAGMAYFVHRQRDLVAASLDRLHRLEDDGQLHRMWPPTAHPGHPSRRAG
ncbi:ATP-grasp domain-containing protein [Mycolicibacterium sp. Dal123E01]|uniref:ATP-grasp domain-containing protein n=1 Tax=Mycolicibacterium sp. Dal123E01 TaxID=3457578 RepID=UPI00403E77F2